MQIQGLLHSSSSTLRFPHKVPIFRRNNPCRVPLPRILELQPPSSSSSSSPPSSILKSRLVKCCCISPADEVAEGVGLEGQSVWEQMKEIVKFTGPAAGLWICSPLMSLIDTVVIAQGSSLELAALGPGTVLCDNMSYVFMFLSIATSNMVATSLAKEVGFLSFLVCVMNHCVSITRVAGKGFSIDFILFTNGMKSAKLECCAQDKEEVQYQLSVLLFIGLTCGFMMFLFTKFFGPSVLAAFAGSNNSHIVPAANTYVQIRGLAWPVILIGWVAQSASLGMKDALGPLKALIAATAVNGIGDVVLCRVLGFGIAGAAWATLASQVVAAYMMMDSLNKKGYNAYAISVPTTDDLVKIFGLAAPVFVMMISKVAFFSLLVYFTTSMSTLTVAAHQVFDLLLPFFALSANFSSFRVLRQRCVFFRPSVNKVVIQVFMMGTVWGEPLCQTAQTFMPELLYGMKQSLTRARMLLKSLMITGTILGLGLATLGTSVLWFFPTLFTPDIEIIREMHTVLIPYFLALSVTPCSLTLEGTLLAGRDLRFISLSMSGCFTLGALALLIVSSRGYGLPGCWFVMTGFQWARFFLALQRLLSPSGMLFSQDLKLKAA
ncbi:Protein DETOXIFICATION 46, chloroplastic [Linum grandiflorum]